MISQLDKKLYRDLWRLKGQVFAIAIVVACGIATYVMAATTMESLSQAKSTYYDRYRMGDLFSYVKRAPLRLTERLSEIDGVARVYPRISFPVTLDVPNLVAPATGVLISVPENGPPPLGDLYLRKGRMLLPSESDAILASEGFVDANGLHPGDSIAAIINGRKKSLKIVGVVLSPEYIYSIAPGSMLPDDQRYGVLWMNRRALEAAVDMDGAFNNMVISTLPGSNEQMIIDKVDTILKPYGGLDTIERKYQLSNFFIENELTQLKNMVFILPLIFLGVAAFLLNIVLARQISLEREQIGMLKALGMSDVTIGFHYMKFAIAIVLIGTILGALLGITMGQALTNMYTQFFRFPVLSYIFDPKVVIIGGLFSLAAAFMGTIGGVWRVIKLPPAEAMHSEPPASYRQMFLEWFGIQHWFESPGRMIIRHLERRPFRALLSISGISISLAILIAASFGIDSMYYMIDVQYNVANREDVTLNFNESKPIKALDEVKRLPGVLAAEPFRYVPARLTFESRSHRTGVTGVTSGAKLKHMIDDDLNHVEVPDQGIMLSEKLGRILGIGIGDILTIEVLEGRRPTAEVIVSGMVQEFVGANAFMKLEVLNSLMGDPPLVSGAALFTGGSTTPELFREVKNIPQISGSILKQYAIDSMEKTMGDTIITMSIFNTLFAGLIAFGVVYNTARISLSERARELASMRVLGFRSDEVAFILLGELAILVLLSIPVGILFGVGLAQLFVTSLDTELFRIPLIITNRTLGYSVLVVVVASSLSGWVVWRRVKELDIVSVLKTRE